MRAYILIAAVVLTGIVPFATRAVYLDEHIFIEIARAAQDNWLFPADTPWIFFGMPIPNLAAHTHPPAGEYYLAVLYAFFGEFREVPFRILFAIFPIAAALAFYKLAQRFTAQPLLTTLLFALSPAFFVYSPTLMMDIPMLAFLLTGYALYFAHVQGRRGFLLLASLSWVLSVGTGYTALVPLGCFFVGLVAARRPWQELLSVAIAPLALAVWLGAMTLHFGEFPLGATVAFFASQVSPGRNLMAIFSFLGGAAIFPWILGGSRRLVFGAVLVAGFISLFGSWPTTAYRLWYVVLASAGLALLAKCFCAARRLIGSGKNSGEAFLILWVPATLAFFVVVADMVNARYVLLTLPPLYLLTFRDASQRRLTVALVTTALLSVNLAYADFILVKSYRDWVVQNVAPVQQQGFEVWSAAESGLRFYLNERAIDTLHWQDRRPQPADLIVFSDMFRYAIAPDLEIILTVLKKFSLNHSFPIRTFNKAAGAGFHDSRIGMVPFMFSRAAFDEVAVAQVSPLQGAVWSSAGPLLKQSQPELLFPMKIPANTAIKYDLEAGDGNVEVTAEGIRLKKGAAPTILWRNFRIVPNQFAVQ